MTAIFDPAGPGAPGLPRRTACEDQQAVGTLDLEKGMRASHVSSFATILAIVLVMLAVFNSAGLVRWAQRLPSGPVSSWVAERAADWDHLMQNPPSTVLKELRKALAGVR